MSEALALEVADLSLDTELPTIRVRQGKGRKSRIVPVHPELGAAFSVALSYGNVSDGRIIDVHRTTAWRWVQRAHATSRTAWRDTAGAGDRKPYLATQLRTASVDERHPH